MVNGLALGLGIFCFILCYVCFQNTQKGYGTFGIQIACAIINGILGILNFGMAFMIK